MKVKGLPLLAAVVATACAGAVTATVAGVEANAESTALLFDANSWVVENGVTLDGGNAITFAKETHVGDNYALLHTKATYSNFHLQYKLQYNSAANEPWWGKSGVLLHGDGEGADGNYFGLYEWGGPLYAAVGTYVDNQFYFVWGQHAGWGNEASFAENVIDIYVKDGHCNILMNGWLLQNEPMPYTTSGVVSIISDGVTATYKDFIIEPLADDYDLTAAITRANWTGSNNFGDMWAWNSAGLNHSFRMQLPDSLDGVQKYYLARYSKIVDKGQTVDVYVDKTGTLALNDTWTDKVGTWGDKDSACTHGNAISGINMIEVPVSAFDGATAGSKVGFLIDKNEVGWYTAGEYYLLYVDAQGDLRVSDYINMAYAFDYNAHNFEYDQPEAGVKGHLYACQYDGLITSHFRGQLVTMTGKPTITKVQDLSYEFAAGEQEKIFDGTQYVKVEDYQFTSVLSYSVDGGAESATLVLPAAEKSGVITVKLSPVGKANDHSGEVVFDPVTVEIPYTTTIAEAAIEYVTVTVVSDGTTIDTDEVVKGSKIDLSQYAPTKEGYTLSGWSDGTNTYTVLDEVTANETLTLTAQWRVNTYRVRVYDGDQAVLDETVEHGATVTYTPAEKEGYTFVGLFSDEACTQAAELPATVTEDVTLYAQWRINTYRVLVYDGAQAALDQTVDYGTTVTYTPAEKEGYTFVGLFSDEACTQAAELPTAVTADVTLYALWEAIPVAPQQQGCGSSITGGLGMMIALIGAGFVIFSKKK